MSAECSFLFGNKLQALKDLEIVLTLNPLNTAALYLKGKIKNSFNEENLALECFKECLQEVTREEGENGLSVNSKEFPCYPSRN